MQKLTKNKIVTVEDAISIIADWKSTHEKVVFTNGCFDILHLGHIDYLEKSASLGNKLIVAVNSDESVQKLKGPSRPINDEYARTRLMAALEFVDLVVLFGDDTPLNIINNLKPTLLVKGDDYDASETDVTSKSYIVGSKEVRSWGGDVQTISLVEGYSTTNIINKSKS